MWISFKDRQPPRKRVILYFPALEPRGHNSNGLPEMFKVDYAAAYPHRESTHWMPLPKPPAEQGQTDV